MMKSGLVITHFKAIRVSIAISSTFSSRVCCWGAATFWALLLNKCTQRQRPLLDSLHLKVLYLLDSLQNFAGDQLKSLSYVGAHGCTGLDEAHVVIFGVLEGLPHRNLLLRDVAFVPHKQKDLIGDMITAISSRLSLSSVIQPSRRSKDLRLDKSKMTSPPKEFL